MEKPRRASWRKELAWPVIVISLVGFVAYTFVSKRTGYVDIVDAVAIEKLLAGNVLKTEQFSFYYAPNGYVYGRIGSQGDRGTWVAEQGGYCEHWLVWGEGQKICWELERKGKFIRRTGQSIPSYKAMPVVNELVWQDGAHLR